MASLNFIKKNKTCIRVPKNSHEAKGDTSIFGCVRVLAWMPSMWARYAETIDVLSMEKDVQCNDRLFEIVNIV